MTLVQLISIIVFALIPPLTAASFWFVGIPQRQRQALEQFVPIAVKLYKQKDTLSHDAKVHLASVWVTDAFRASWLPHYSAKIIEGAIEAELQE